MAAPFQNEIVDGFRFKGGDPADQNAWEAVTGLKPGDIQDGFTFRGGDPSKQEAWERGTSINRTWTEAITDTARDATAGTLEAASGLTGLFRRAGSATQTGQANLSDIETGQSAVDTSSQISQPGILEKALSGTAEVIRDEQSDKRKWQRQALQDTDGAWEAAKFLVTNPTAIGGLMAESAPGSLLAGGVGGFVGKAALAAGASKAAAMSAAGIGAMAGEGILSAGSLASDIEKLLDKQGIMDPEVRSKAINIAYASGLATGYLGKIGKGIEVMPFMRESIKESLAKAVPKAMLKEGAEEFAQSFQETVAKNLALGQAGAKDEDGKDITNLTQGAAKEATVGAIAGIGTGGVMPLASRGLDKLQPTPPDETPPTPSPDPILAAPDVDTAIAEAFKSAGIRDLQDQAIALDGGDNASQLVSSNPSASQGTPAIQAAGNSVPQTPDAVQNAAENLPAVDAAARTDVANAAPDMAQKAGNDDISAGRGAAGDISNSGISANVETPNFGVSSADGQQAIIRNEPDRAPGVPGSAAAIEPAVARAPGVDPAPATGPAAQNERANATPTGRVDGTPAAGQDNAAQSARPQGGTVAATGNERASNASKVGSGVPKGVGQSAAVRNDVAAGSAQPDRRAAARNYDADVADALNKARELGRALRPDSPKSDVDAAYRAAMAAEDLREAREQERKAPKFVDYAEKKGKAKGEIKFFSNASAALKYKGNKKIRGYVPRETSDGWVLSKPFKPRSEKQLANDAKKKAKTEPIDILRDELQVALRKMGGIDIDEALASGFDKADIARANIPGFGNRKLFRKGGMSLDAAREAIAQGSEQAGYLDPNQADDLNHFIDRLMDSVKDQASYYSFAGQEYQLAMSEAAREADRARNEAQLDREDQAEAGIDSLPKQEQNEVQAAWASIDRSMLERIYPSDVIEELSAAEAQRRKEQEDEITAFAEREAISENGEGSPADRTRSAQDDRGDEPRSAGRGDEGNTDEAGQGTRSEVTNSVYTSEERVKETAESAQVNPDTMSGKVSGKTPVETPVNTPVQSDPVADPVTDPLIAAADRMTAAAERMASAAESFLQNQTPAELQAKKDAEEKSAKEKADADRKAAEAESKAQERETVRQRSEGAAADFQLGQSAMDNLTGQKSMFDRKAADKITDSAGFKNWLGNATLVRLDEKHEYKSGEPVVVEGLHGTTSDFAVFNRSKSSVESDLGAGFYITNTREDVGTNYAGLGPDLTGKVERTAERYEQMLEDEAWAEGKSDKEIKAEAMRRARADYMNNEGFTMPVFVKFENPVVIGGKGETFLDMTEDYNEETEEYGEPTGKLVDLVDALRNTDTERFGDANLEQAISDLFDAADGNEGLQASDVIRILSESEGLQYATDYEGSGNGDMAFKEIIRQAFKEAGFDGFIDQTPYAKFGPRKVKGAYSAIPVKGMEGITPDTVHFVAFEPNQIKSAIGNRGTFDPNSDNILFSRGGIWKSQMSDAIGTLMANQEPAKALSLKVEAWAKSGKFKQDELTWSGLSDWLKIQDGKVTKQQVQDFIRGVSNAEAAVRMYAQGASQVQIANNLGVTPSSVVEYLDNAGVERRNKGYSDEIKQAAIARYQEGLSVGMVGAELGVNRATVQNWLAAADVPRRREKRIPLADGVKDEAARLYKDEEMSTSEVGARLGISTTAVSEIIRDRGISRSAGEGRAIFLQKNGIQSSRGKKTPWQSSKTGEWNFADSSYEIVRMSQLDNDESVSYWTKGRYRIELPSGKFYVPDLYIEYKDGRLEVEEVKGQWQIDSPDVIEKAEAAKSYLGERGISYKIVTENEIGKEALDSFPFDQIPSIDESEKKARKQERDAERRKERQHLINARAREKYAERRKQIQSINEPDAEIESAQGGLPLFARNQKQAQSIQASDARAATDVITKKWKNAPKITVHESLTSDSVPAGLRSAMEKEGVTDARGAWYAGAIEIFPSNIGSLAELERTIVHEARHYGLEGLFGKDMNPILMEIYLKDKGVRTEANRLVKTLKVSTVDAVNETLANMPLDAAKKLPGWQKLIAKLKAWLNDRGFTNLAKMLEGPSADAITKDILYQVEQFVKTGKRGDTTFTTTLFHRAFHGTPHDFDQFTTNAMGTGEGAQAYGWGLYFAGNQAVADYYRKELSQRKLTESSVVSAIAARKPAPKTSSAHKLIAMMQTMNSLNSDDIKSAGLEPEDFGIQEADGEVSVRSIAYFHNYGAYDYLREVSVSGSKKYNAFTFRDGSMIVDDGSEASAIEAPNGKLYEVELAPKQEDYLDWDKPLSEQSEKVKAAINKLPDRVRPQSEMEWRNVDADRFYRRLAAMNDTHGQNEIGIDPNGERKASELLKSVGIPGIRYLDGSSRSKGEGNYNFVIFDDKDVSIVAKYSRTDQTESRLRGTAVVNKDGTPMRVYHGTTKEFGGDIQTPAFFTSDREIAASSYYAGDAGRVIDAYLDIKNPLDVTTKAGSMKLIAIARRAGATITVEDGENGWSFETDEIRNNSPYDGTNLNDLVYSERVRDQLSKEGYDGIKAFDVHGNEEVPIFVPLSSSQIIAAPSKQKQTESPAFKKWFGTSKVIDDSGAPLIVHHGTVAYDPIGKFKAGSRGILGPGMYFTNNRDFAETYTRKGSGGGKVLDVYLRISRPLIIEGGEGADVLLKAIYGRDSVFKARERKQSNTAFMVTSADVLKLKKDDYDGIIWKHPAGNEYVVWESQQIKSATDNNGEFSRTNPDIRFDRTAADAPKKWDSPEPSKMDSILYKLADKQIDLKRVTEAVRDGIGEILETWDAYLKETLFHGRSAKRVATFAQKELKPLLTEMQMRGVTIPELETYLHNRHAEERNKQVAKINPKLPDRGSGITTKDARAYLAGLTTEQRTKYEALAKRIDAITKGTRQTLQDYGLMSNAEMAQWEGAYKHYVPLMKDTEVTGQGEGFSIRGDESKRALGDGAIDSNILANLMAQRERAIVRGEKNRVALSLYGLAKLNPNADFWSVDNPPIIRRVVKLSDKIDRRTIPLGMDIPENATEVVVEGPDPMFLSRENVIVTKYYNPATDTVTEKAIVFNEDNPRAVRMAAALKNLDADQMGEIMNVMAKATRFLASVNTQYNPIFGLVNLTRDVQGAVLNLTSTELAGKQKQVLALTPKALAAVYLTERNARKGREPKGEWGKLYDEFQNVGAQTGYRDLFTSSQDRADALQREINKITEGKVKQAGRAIFDWLSDYNQAMENSVRLAAYKVGLDQGLSKEAAANVAKNLTVNFNRKGQITQQAGALYAFFNASVQGTARLAQTLKGPAGKRILIGGLILGALQAMMLAGFDEDEPPQFERERNLIIPIGGKNYFKIPMPLGLHVIPNISRILIEMGIHGKPMERLFQLMSVTVDAFNPIGAVGLSAQTFTPTVADPFVALGENRDWTGKPIAREDFSSLNPTPGHSRSKDTASIISKTLSEGLNWASGGTEFTKGKLSPTPDQLDYLFGQVGGGVWREGSKFQQSISSAFTGEELPPYKIPVIGRFYGSTGSQASKSALFYRNLKQLNAHEAEIEGRQKAGQDPSDYIRDNPDSELYQAANRIEREISKRMKQKRQMVKDNAPKSDVKDLENEMAELMHEFNQEVAARRGK